MSQSSLNSQYDSSRLLAAVEPKSCIMLACLPRRQNQPAQHLPCAAKILDAPVNLKSDLSSMQSPRYPSTAELDAYAQKTADCPLSIKIFPSNIRVPQHKQIGRTVNGLDTTGQRFSPYSQPYSTGYQGLLAIVKAPTVTKGIVKSSDGKRTKLSPIQMAVAPYAPPSGNSMAHRHHRQRPYSLEICKPPEVHNVAVPPNVVVPVSATSLSSGQSLALASHSASLGMVRQMARTSHAQGIQASVEDHSSPSHQAATACLDSSFSMDMAKTTGYMDTMEYAIWQSKQQRHQQQKQHYQQGPLHRYSANNNNNNSSNRATISRSPEVCLPPGTTQIPYRAHALSTGSCVTGVALDRVGSSPLNCTATHGDFSTGQFFAPHWNSTLATPDCYNPQELPQGSVGLGHSHGRPQRQAHCVPQQYPGLGMCCGLCHASLLSSSLQSLECLISEIHPPCIKERMLGRGYEAAQPAHIQLPVFR